MYIHASISSASSKFTLSLTGPDFTSHKVKDPFKRLGPIAIFSARRHWTAPRCVRLQKGSSLYHSVPSNDNKCPLDNDDDEEDGGYNLYKEEFENFGFHVRGDAPVIIAHVEINSLADVSKCHFHRFVFVVYCRHYFQLGGIKEGDFIVEIAGVDVKWYSHQQVVQLIQSCGSTLELRVITPMDRNYLKVHFVY